MSFPQARPTVYRGIKMRSRLEARYAAYLDDKGETWTYEPRAYASQQGQYLPDFEVVWAGERLLIEVKPTIEAAEKVLPRMQIVHESDPEAILIVDVPDAGLFVLFAEAHGLWRWTARRSS